MTQDLRCPVCGSGKINYSGTSTTMGGGYESTDARYVCEDCGYTGALILDVSKDDYDDEINDNNDNKPGTAGKAKKRGVEIDIEKIGIIAIVCILSSVLVGIYSKTTGINAGIYFGIFSTISCILGYVLYCFINPVSGSGDVKSDLKEIDDEEEKFVKPGNFEKKIYLFIAYAIIFNILFFILWAFLGRG